MRHAAVVLLLVLATAAALPGDLAAQAADLGSQRLGRAYWHVFAAYAIGWLLILGWVVTIFRRLRRVEDRLTAAERDAGA